MLIVTDQADFDFYTHEQIRALQEQAWDNGFEAAEWADKLRRWQQPVNVENPYRKEG